MPGGLVRLAVRVRATRKEEALAALLPVLAGGAEERAVGDVVEYALYGAADELPDEAALRALAGDAVLGVSRTPVAGGWETAWHAHLGRVSAGGFAIRPPWVAGPDEDLVIEPGLTFGAAGHPTTRLCLELLADVAAGRVPTTGERRASRGRTRSVHAHGAGSETLDRREQAAPPAVRPSRPATLGQTAPLGSLCDWGCGSGVLAVAAARLGFEPVVAVDNDPAAVAITRENAQANGVHVDVRRIDVTRDAPWAPTVVANLTLPLLEAAAAQGPRPRMLIASGVLARDADRVAAAFGMAERDRREEDGWAAVLL